MSMAQQLLYSKLWKRNNKQRSLELSLRCLKAKIVKWRYLVIVKVRIMIGVNVSV